jgi:hypothetical protein
MKRRKEKDRMTIGDEKIVSYDRKIKTRKTK